PARPDHAAPGTRDDADCVGVQAASVAGSLVERARPGGGVSRCVRERRERDPQANVARVAERDGAVLTRLLCHWSDTAFGGEMLGGNEATAVVAELGEELGGAQAPASEERRDDFAVGMGLDRMLDRAGERRDLRDKWTEHGDERTDALTLRFGFCFA